MLWPKIAWNISYHIHSTLTKDLKELDAIKLFKNISCKDNKNIVKVFVIWQQSKFFFNYMKNKLKKSIA